MNLENVLANSNLSIIIGTLVPLVLPYLYKLVCKITKGELTKEGKRLVNTIVAIVIALGIILVNYEWSGVLKEDIFNFVSYLLINYTAVKGAIQTIYEMLIKGIPEVDRFLTKVQA